MFWSVSIHDYDAGWDGYLERIGAKSAIRPPSAQRLKDLMALYPDTPRG